MKKLYFLFTFLLLAIGISYGQASDLYFSMYGEGSSNNKWLEIYNGTGSDVDLSSYSVELYSNGATTATNTLSLTGTLVDGDVYVIYNSGSDPAIIANGDISSNVTFFNGDDAIALLKLGAVIDVIGEIGIDPGSAWNVGSTAGATVNHTLVRKSDVCDPNPVSLDSFGTDDATSEWVVYDIDLEWGQIGSHVGCVVNACGVTLGSANYTCSTNTIGDNNDSVIIEIPYTGSDAGITGLTPSNGNVGGNDPSSDVDGIIVITGLSEGDAWGITLNGGDCDGTMISGTVPAAQCDPAPNTCFDISNGAELFEMVTVATNSDLDEWQYSAGTYSMNGYCGGGCAELVDTWLIFGPLDMSAVSDLSLAFDASEGFSGTDLTVVYTNSYTGCPSGTSWTGVQIIIASGSYDIDLSSVSGTDVFIGINYNDDGADGYSSWSLSNVALEAFGTCPTLGTRPTSDCAVCDLALGAENYICGSNTEGPDNDTVTIEIPYTGSESSGTLSTTSGGIVTGDISVADGLITITGLSEGDAWDLTITGGDCGGTTISGTVGSTLCDPVTTDLVINEILADPDAVTGDANGDGIIDTSDDEFVEIYNIGSSDIDLSNYTISDAVGVRHTFPSNTILSANSFITVFGGGTPTGIGGLSQVASSGFLGFNNGGDTVTLKNPSDATVVEYTYGSEGGNNQSLARDPDFTGAFVQHLSHSTNPVQFSPGARNDGTLSVSEFGANTLSIYPNPTSTGFVNIVSTNSSPIQVKVFDILGKQVKNETINSTLNVSGLKSGIYILNITQEGHTVTKKLVID